MKYLGIDYGLKKIGLALSEGEIATTYKVVSINSLKNALDQILDIINKEEIKQVVIGLAESGESKSAGKRFIEGLKKQDLSLEIITVDETLSTKSAQNLMIQLGKSKGQRREDDAYAASLILQNYLDSLN